MFSLIPLTSLEDFFLPPAQRPGKGVYGCRITGMSPEIRAFLPEYLAKAKSKGLLQEAKLPNPTPQQISFYQEMIGGDFHLTLDFFQGSLKRWLPRLSQEQNHIIASAMLASLQELEKQGKNANILKNIFIKLMCWMYYRLEQLLRQLGQNEVAKILYQGSISDYELRLFAVCQKAGCDILLIEPEGDGQYQGLDPENCFTKLWKGQNLQPFPPDFSLGALGKQQQQQAGFSALYQGLTWKLSSERWKKGRALDDLCLSNGERGGKKDVFYPIYTYIKGVEDKADYVGQLYRCHESLVAGGRGVLVINQLTLPTAEETNQISKRNYRDTVDLVGDLCRKISFPKNISLQKWMIRAFGETLLEDGDFLKEPLNRQTNQGIYLLAWLKRYQGDLFSTWQEDKLSVCFFLQGAQKPVELLFQKFLSKLPVDLLILVPDLSKKPLEDGTAMVEEYPQSLALSAFPTELGQMGTTAYHAEQELDGLLYQDTGFYRNHQYTKAKSVSLKTMYEEIAILWHQENNFRPNFWTKEGEVHVPVIFAKVSGVAEGNTSAYWSGVKKLLSPQCLVASRVPFIEYSTSNPFLEAAPQFWKNNQLDRQKILNHKDYSYGFLRQEVQAHILDKLALMLSQKSIKGMGVNGTENKVIALVLTLPQTVLRLVQGMDFTKVPPKCIYIHSKETMPSVEDSIFLAFLHLLGFDVVVFVPTGYQSVEIHYTKPLLEEHQIGTFVYDMAIPKLSTKEKGFFPAGNKLFRRGES